MKFKENKLILLLCTTIVTLLVLPSLWTHHLREVFHGLFILRETRSPVSQVEALERENVELKLELQKVGIAVLGELSIPAQVLQRDPGMWDSLLWINKGKRDGVSQNAPVLSGVSLVGLVEEVQKRCSLVRLISDSHLPVSVRVSRGNQDARILKQKLRELKDLIDLQGLKGESFVSTELKTSLAKEIESPLLEKGDTFLAKGLVLGKGSPLWRSQGYYLKGKGFNFDFADETGQARDLQSGVPFNKIAHKAAISLIQAGDILTTTGLDGVFPEGLHVGVVTQVYPLDEGGVSYEIEAVPTAGSLTELKNLVVLKL